VCLIEIVSCFLESGEDRRCIGAFQQYHVEIFIILGVGRCGAYIVSLSIGV